MLRKVFLDELPRNKSRIDWCNSVGMKVKFVYDDIEGEIEILDKLNNDTLLIGYRNKKYEIRTTTFRYGKIGNLLGIKTKEYRFNINTRIKDEKRDIVIIDREYRERKRIKNKKTYIETEKWYKYKCNICSNENWIREHSLMKQGCNVCCKSSQKTLKGYNDIATTHPNLIKYFYNEEDAFKYTFGSKRKVKFRCLNCNSISSHIIKDYLKSVINENNICPNCGDGFSYPNKFMYNLLSQTNIEFISEYSPEWLKRKRFDFYIPSKNLIIEMDGGLGHGNSTHSKSSYTINELAEVDKWKDEQAKIHNLKVIRIDCNYKDITNRFDYIKNSILKINLLNNLNIKNIDWEKVKKNCLKSIVKEICEYKNTHENVTLEELSRIFNIGKTTCCRYLNQGRTLGYCTYDKDIYVNSKKKKVEVFKDNVSLGIFDSLIDLERNSIELFGTLLNRKSIRSVCNGERETYKGFTFKYV